MTSQPGESIYPGEKKHFVCLIKFFSSVGSLLLVPGLDLSEGDPGRGGIRKKPLVKINMTSSYVYHNKTTVSPHAKIIFDFNNCGYRATCQPNLVTHMKLLYEEGCVRNCCKFNFGPTKARNNKYWILACSSKCTCRKKCECLSFDTLVTNNRHNCKTYTTFREQSLQSLSPLVFFTDNHNDHLYFQHMQTSIIAITFAFSVLPTISTII